MNHKFLLSALLCLMLGGCKTTSPDIKRSFIENLKADGFTALNVQQSIQTFDVGQIIKDEQTQNLYGSLWKTCNQQQAPTILQGRGPDSLAANSTYDLNVSGSVGFEGSSLSAYVPNVKLSGDLSQIKTVKIKFTDISIRKVDGSDVDNVIASCPVLASRFGSSIVVVNTLLLGQLNLTFLDKDNRKLDIKVGWSAVGLEGKVTFKREDDATITSEQPLAYAYQSLTRRTDLK